MNYRSEYFCKEAANRVKSINSRFPGYGFDVLSHNLQAYMEELNKLFPDYRFCEQGLELLCNNAAELDGNDSESLMSYLQELTRSVNKIEDVIRDVVREMRKKDSQPKNDLYWGQGTKSFPKPWERWPGPYRNVSHTVPRLERIAEYRSKLMNQLETIKNEIKASNLMLDL